MSKIRKPLNFIEQVIEQDLKEALIREVITRFPPEPNGYLHIGHAKSICLNFGLAEQYGGVCNLRFDDTNPDSEKIEYVEAIKKDVTWLGFQWHAEPRFTSDYFDQLYHWAQSLIRENKAYICELSPEKMREYRGTLTEPGKNSPYRDRPPTGSLMLFELMKEGDVEEGHMTLRAKIDMSAPNINMRDPVIYRVKNSAHHRTQNTWNIFPSYDFAHGQADAIEGITHSVCTLEFADNRPLYEWFLANLPVASQPRQYEFGRLNLSYTVTSKRKLKRLVEDGHVQSWDDPRMPTLSGLRRRGVRPQAIRSFCDSLAVSKTDGVVDMAQFEHFIRDDLNQNACRAMCVLRPLLVTLSNFAKDDIEHLTMSNHPSRDDLGDRVVPFSRQLYIEQDDFSDDNSLSRKKFRRLVIGDYVRLRGAYIIRADEIVRDPVDNSITEVIASVVPNTVAADAPEGLKPRGVIHWVSNVNATSCRVNSYERLFTHETPDATDEVFTQHINPKSLISLSGCKAESSLAEAVVGVPYQFERLGYFCVDSGANRDLTFNLTIGLRDNWKA